MKHKENDILDDFLATSNSKNSRLSVKFFTYNLLTLSLMYILMIVMSHSTLNVKLLSNIQMVLSVGFLFTSLNGIVFAFQSIREKEKKRWLTKSPMWVISFSVLLF